MTFLKNLGMFFWVFLPAVTLANMAYAVLFGQPNVAPEWKLGWNPIPWLIITSPWLLPTVAAVPVLHWLGSRWTRLHSARMARTAQICATMVLFMVILVALWGRSYLNLESGIPVAAGAALYGALFALPPVKSA